MGLFGSTGILLRIALCRNWRWLPNQSPNGNDIARKWKYASKRAYGTLFHSCFSWFQRKMQGFISFDFISEETLFTSPFSRIGLGLAVCADGGTIYFHFFSVHVFNSVAGKL